MILNTKRKKEKKKGREEGGREREGYSDTPESSAATSLERSIPAWTASRSLSFTSQRSKARPDSWALAGKVTSAVLEHQMC